MVRNKRSEMLFKLCTYPKQNDCQKSTLTRIFSLDSYCRSINYHLCQSFLLKYLIQFFVTFFDESRLFCVALPSNSIRCRLPQIYVQFISEIHLLQVAHILCSVKRGNKSVLGPASFLGRLELCNSILRQRVTHHH